MTITHFRASIIQGARGPVAAAAYRHRAAMYDMAAARTWDYSGAGVQARDQARDRASGQSGDQASDLAHAEIVLPDGAPAWIAAPAETMSRASLSELLWNAAAMTEQRYDAQTAREITIALPSELSQEQNIALVRAFVAGELVSRGFAVDWVYTAWSPAADAMRMIERQFGQGNRIAETAAARGPDASMVARLQRFSDRVTAAQQELAREESRSRRR